MLPRYYPEWMKTEYLIFEKSFSEYIFNSQFQGIPLPQIQYGLFPGRRTRPTLFIAFARTLEVPISKELLNLTYAIEFFHRASLLLDDILDGEETRRKLTVFHKKYGIANAILLSQYYISEGLKLLVKHNIYLLPVWVECFQEIIIGEYLDVNSKQNSIASFDKVVKKTVGFFDFMGNSLMHNSAYPHIIDLFSLLGKAFQVSNDYHDAMFGVEEREAKEKITYGNSLVQSIITKESADNHGIDESIIIDKINDHYRAKGDLNTLVQEMKIACNNYALPEKTKVLAKEFLDLLLIKDYWYHGYTK
jgi:geranylgeranyl pyrophosphate synthase